jgi:hypothetical protein
LNTPKNICQSIAFRIVFFLFLFLYIIIISLNQNFMSGVYYQLYRCVLQPGETLSYNATAGVNGTWQIYDARGQGISAVS